jgi:hypothetical protein
MGVPALPSSTSDGLRSASRFRALSTSRLVFFFSIALAAFGLVSAPAPACAQDPVPTGRLTAVVVDSAGQPVRDVVVVVRGFSGVIRRARTGVDGRFTATGLPPDRYEVLLAAAGAGDWRIESVETTAGVQRVTGVRRIGQDSALLDFDGASRRDGLGTDILTNLPLNTFRNYQSLTILAPGTLPPTFANAENDTPQRSLTLRMNGHTGAAIRTHTDGTTNLNLWLPAHTMYVPPVEAISDVTIRRGPADAGQGFSAGPSIEVTTASGTNAVRGSAFEFFNGDALNAAPFRSRKLPIERHTAGGTLGGPIVRSRLFAFGSYEGYFSRVQAQRFYAVPGLQLRNGDFSQALNGSGGLQRIYDPFTPGADTVTGTGRAQVSYFGPPACSACATGMNVLDPSRLHPIARKILALYPLPNRQGSGRAGLTNNFSRVESSSTNRHNLDLKITARPPAAGLWGRVSQMHGVVDDRWVFPVDPVDEDGGVTNVWQIAGGIEWALNDSALLDLSIGLTTLDQHVNSSDSFLGHYGLEVLGIPGTNHQGRTELPHSARYQGLPTFSTGFSTIGTTPTWAPQTRAERTISASFQLAKLFGKHELRAGYALNRFTLEHWQPERQNPRGAFQFASNATRLGGGGQQSANAYNTYAAFLLGLVGSAGKSLQTELFTTRESQHALYVHDRWSVSSRLDVDAGIRWEYYPLMSRAGRGFEMTDLATLEILVGGRGGLARHLGLTPPTDHFAPRLGATWALDAQTTARARFGLSFDGLAWARPFRGDASYPNAINARFLPPGELQQFGWFGTLDAGVPLIPLPDASAGRLSLPAFVSDQRTLEPETLERPRVHSWSVAVERELPHELRVDVAYVGNKGVDGWMDINVNAVRTLGGGAGDRPYNVAPFFTTQPITVFRGYTDREYHALQVSVHRDLRDGLTLRSAYTLSRSMILGREYELPAFADRNWHPSSDDRPHMLSVGFVWELPWRTGRGFTGAAGWLLNDWQLNGILTAFSGAPFTVRADATELNTPGNVQTADLVGPVVRLGDIGGEGFFYDPSAFAEPTGQRLGETTINQFRGPGGANLDLSVFRNLQLPGGRRLQFRLEALNATNTPKYGNPDGNLSSSTFMRVFSLNDAYTERQIRVAARYVF